MTSSPRRIAPRSHILLALIGLVFLGAGVATWLLMPPPKITARTQLHVATIQPNILFPDDGHVKQEDFVRNQVYLIKDRFVLTAALRSPEVAELSMVKEQTDPVQWLESELKVETPTSEFIHISLSGDRPRELQKLVSAVTQSYLDNVVDKESHLRKKKLDDIKKIFETYNRRVQAKRERIKQLQKENGALEEHNRPLLHLLAIQDLQAVMRDLGQVRRELRKLHVELGLRPDWVEMVWPRYAAALNCLPGPALPVNHAVVALLHDDAQILSRTAREKRRQIWERYTTLKELEKTLLSDAERLERETKHTRRDAVDLGELKQQMEKEEKVMQRAAEKIEEMEVEQDAASRITLQNKDETTGKPLAMLSTPNESIRKMMTRVATVLAGLGLAIILLAFTLSRFSAHKGYDYEEHPPNPSSPE